MNIYIHVYMMEEYIIFICATNIITHDYRGVDLENM